MEWTREKTLLLINEYRKRRGLWDMTHDDYRKKEIKQKLLHEVNTSLGGGIAAVEIEKKFHTLRTQYHREINRMKRKEPYNSKWFGFKNLQFLSSPKACRSSKGRIKSEITEEGTVTTKYIIREAVGQDNSEESPNSNSNINDEFLTIHRKPTITYETVANGGSTTVTVATNRSHELEKLIEETTKDVEDIEESKPKMTLKEITVPLEHHTYNSAQLHSASSAEMSTSEADPLHQHETHHHHQHHQHHQPMDEDEDAIGTIDIHPVVEDEIAYQSSGSTGGGHSQANTMHQHHAVPTRIIKIQRRDTCQEDDYYDHQANQQAQHQIHTLPTNTAKRIYYEANGHQHTATIITASSGGTPPPNAQSSLISTTPKSNQTQQQQQQSPSPSQQNQTQAQQALSPSQQLQDEFATFGTYVANEMRGITNREILIALKHKINTALFEASMAQLQK